MLIFTQNALVVGPVPQQRRSELQVFALLCCSCSGNRCRGSARAAWQVQWWQLTRNIKEHRIPEALQGDILVTSAEPVAALAWLSQGPQDGHTGVPEVQGAGGRPPQQQWGLLPTELVAPMESWGRGAAPGCGGKKEGLGKRTSVGNRHKKKRNNGSPQSALLFQWFAGCMSSFCYTGRAHLYSPLFHQCFTAHGLCSCWSSHRY